MVMERPLREFLAAVDSRKPFALSRWGEHEWHCIFGERNGFIPPDGHGYFPALCRDLTAVLHSRPDYRLGIPAEAYSDRVRSYIDGCALDDLDWQVDVLKLTHVDQLLGLVGAVSRVPLLVVGPPRLRKSKALLRWRAFVDVPPRNSYLCRDDIVRNVLAALEDFKVPALVSVSAGVTAPLIINDLARRPGGCRHQLVDFGSLWESFGG